jgi:hypothetical protein
LYWNWLKILLSWVVLLVQSIVIFIKGKCSVLSFSSQIDFSLEFFIRNVEIFFIIYLLIFCIHRVTFSIFFLLINIVNKLLLICDFLAYSFDCAGNVKVIRIGWMLLIIEIMLLAKHVLHLYLDFILFIFFWLVVSSVSNAGHNTVALIILDDSSGNTTYVKLLPEDICLVVSV